MKYKTVIELVCNARDKDEATYTAGEYLRGNIDSGVEMKSNTRLLNTHRVIKYGATSLISILLISVIYLGVSPFFTVSGNNASLNNHLPANSTVQPELKTNGKEEFKKTWEMKKQEAILDYIRN